MSPQPLSSLARRRVAVIGAGAGGLVAARELAREGMEVDVFEAGPRVGGVWAYDEARESDLLSKDPGRSRVQGSMYASLRTNLPRETMGFTDYPFSPSFAGSRDPRQFPGHAEVLAYLESFAERYDLSRLIRLDTRVLSVRKVPRSSQRGEAASGPPGGVDGAGGEDASDASGAATREPSSLVDPLALPPHRWEVTWKEGSGGRTSSGDYDFVAVASGHHAEPRLPYPPGESTFPNLVMHSHNYRCPEPFAGKRVLCVGAAASGIDISDELRGVAEEVFLSDRDSAPSPARAEPGAEPEGAARGAVRGEGAVGERGRAAAEPAPVRRKPGVASLNPDGSVTFVDGSEVKNVEVVLYCTGYRYAFPFLPDELVRVSDENAVDPLWKLFLVLDGPRVPTIALIGLPFKVIPFLLMELQSRLAARFWAGRITLPTPVELAAEADHEARDLARQRREHSLASRAPGDGPVSGVLPSLCLDGERQWAYDAELAILAGGPGFAPHIPALYDAAADARARFAGGRYRDLPLAGVDDELLRAREAWP